VALADYYERAALAASQIIAGFEPDLFRRTLEDANVGIAIDRDAASSDEGKTLAELSIRLLARLYPSLEVRAELSSEGERLEHLARAINPRVEFKGGAQIGIAIGRGAIGFDTTCFAGSDGWDALLSMSEPMGIGHSPNPLGASAAARLAVAVKSSASSCLKILSNNEPLIHDCLHSGVRKARPRRIFRMTTGSCPKTQSSSV
jgi:hypothetical protein